MWKFRISELDLQTPPLCRRCLTSSYNDVHILNFVLNLEYLEDEFYGMATYGSTLLEIGVITSAEQSGPTTGGKMVPNFGKLPEATAATALRNDEIDHVGFCAQHSAQRP